MVIGGIEVIEENASDPPRLFPVGNVKVLVAPLLEGRIEDPGGMFVAGDFKGLVEVNRVFLVEIRRSQIAPSSKPPSDDFRGLFRVGDFEVAVVRVDGWCVRVAGMYDQADASSEEGEDPLSVRI